jgi:hypothetical protein
MNRWTKGIAFACCVVWLTQPVRAAPPAGVDPQDVHGAWYLHVSTDKMTDQRQCYLVYHLDKHTWVTDGGSLLIISYLGRGGVDSYKYRMGSGPATSTHFANRREQATSAIEIPVSDADIGDAKRIVVAGLTVLKGLIDNDIDLDGFREAKAAMRTDARCK